MSEIKTCEWKRWESGQYETKCDQVFEFTNGGIKDNHFKFCPFCGGVIVEVVATNQNPFPGEHLDGGCP